MKLKNLIACFFLGFIMVSCIQDEAPNAEADIETCTVPGDVLNRDPIIGNDQITLPLKKGANISKLAPEFTLTPGATINPESGGCTRLLHTTKICGYFRRWKMEKRI